MSNSNSSYTSFIGSIILVIFTLPYLFTLVLASVGTIFKWQKSNSILSTVNALLIVAVTLIYLYRDGYFYGKKVTEAELILDFGRIDLILWEQNYKITTSEFLSKKTIYGQYFTRGDTIILYQKNIKGFPITLVRQENILHFLKDESNQVNSISENGFKIINTIK